MKKLETNLSVNVYKHTYDDPWYNQFDCTNGGISSRVNSLTLVAELDPNNIKDTDVMLKIGGCHNDYVYAIPCNSISKSDKEGTWMFGGNFIYTSDSRFPMSYPIPLFDRFETWEEFDKYSR